MRIGTLKTTPMNIAVWGDMNSLCNYNCDYCFGHSTTEDPAVGKFSIADIGNSFDETGITWWISLSGGEPFLYPQFVDLVKTLTRRHFVAIDTNLSCNIEDFAYRISPDRVICLNCAFHIAEVEKRKQVDKFIEKVLFLREKGFSTITLSVAYPPVLEKIKEYVAIFKSYDLVLQPKIFRGEYDKKEYPGSYTLSELSLIHKYLVDSLSKRYSLIFPSYKGKLCSAGKKFVRIHIDGKVTRCMEDDTLLGNIFEGGLNLLNESKPCEAEYCKCLWFSRIGIVQDEPNYIEEFEKIMHLNDKKSK